MGLLTLIKVSLLNIFYLFGGLAGFGWLFSQLEQWNNRYLYLAFGKWGVTLTGFVGTVVHEASHYAMCLLFGHRVTSVAWFRPLAGQADGVLGYVQHSYDRQNPYQVIGNFFIGIAPLIGGTLAIILLLRFLLPETYQLLKEQIQWGRYFEETSGPRMGHLITLFMQDLGILFKGLFLNPAVWSWRFGLFLFMMYSIVTHMMPSSADLSGSVSGLLWLVGIVCVLTLLLSFIGKEALFLTKPILYYNLFLTVFMIVGLFFLGITLGISFALAKLTGH